MSSSFSYSKKSASSTYILLVDPELTFPIILAVGNISGSKEFLAFETTIPLTTLSTFCFNHVKGLSVGASSIPTPA